MVFSHIMSTNNVLIQFCTIIAVIITIHLTISTSSRLLDAPVVINTWDFTKATAKAWLELDNGTTALDAIVEGCSVCELCYHACGESVGFGGSPDEQAETTLDAMIMDGSTYDVGAVGCLRQVKNAIRIAHAVLQHTKHTLLVGELATQFAIEMGFSLSNLTTSDSLNMWEKWKQSNCQPNFWQSVTPDPETNCGPYKPKAINTDVKFQLSQRYNKYVNRLHHDTIGMVALDQQGNMAAGTTTNGATHKIPGRVGDSPIMGAGAFVDTAVGGAAATGDGDVMMRFLPSFETVKLMEAGMSPTKAAYSALMKIAKYYPHYSGALIALSTNGQHGAACYGFTEFQYSIASKLTSGVQVVSVNCTQNS